MLCDVASVCTVRNFVALRVYRVILYIMLLTLIKINISIFRFRSTQRASSVFKTSPMGKNRRRRMGIYQYRKIREIKSYSTEKSYT